MFPRLLEYLYKLGVGPGVQLRLVEHNYDETLRLECSTGEITLGRAAAERIWVRAASSSATISPSYTSALGPSGIA